MVEHVIVAKVVVVHPSEPKILLLRRSASDVRRPGQWDIPGGKFEPDQDKMPSDGAIRECFEEAGLKFKPDDLKFLTSDHEDFQDNDPKVVDWLFYVAHSRQENITLSYEHDGYLWVEPKEAIDNLLSYPRHIKTLDYALQFGALKS